MLSGVRNLAITFNRYGTKAYLKKSKNKLSKNVKLKTMPSK
jgi:hypothetical protein